MLAKISARYVLPYIIKSQYKAHQLPLFIDYQIKSNFFGVNKYAFSVLVKEDQQKINIEPLFSEKLKSYIIDSKFQESIKISPENSEEIKIDNEKYLHQFMLAIQGDDKNINNFKAQIKKPLESILSQIAKKILEGKEEIDWRQALKMIFIYQHFFTPFKSSNHKKIVHLLLDDSKRINILEIDEIYAIISKICPDSKLSKENTETILNSALILGKYGFLHYNNIAEFPRTSGIINLEIDSSVVVQLRNFLDNLNIVLLNTNFDFIKKDLEEFFSISTELSLITAFPQKLCINLLKLLYFASKNDTIKIENYTKLANFCILSVSKDYSTIGTNIFTLFTFYSARMIPFLTVNVLIPYCEMIANYIKCNNQYFNNLQWKSLFYTIGLCSIRTPETEKLFKQFLSSEKLQHLMKILKPKMFMAYFKNLVLCCLNTLSLNHQEIKAIANFSIENLKIFDKTSNYFDEKLLSTISLSFLRVEYYDINYWSLYFGFLHKNIASMKEFVINHEINSIINIFEIYSKNPKEPTETIHNVLEIYSKFKVDHTQFISELLGNKHLLKPREVNPALHIHIAEVLKSLNISFEAKSIGISFYLRSI